MSAQDWDACTYDRIADPMHRWGVAVLDRLPLHGDERVLDAGCGSGRVTEVLAERLPAGEIVALDASPAMLDEARRRLARFGRRITFVEADLGRPLPLTEPVDAILSTATFHWIGDHDALFRNLAAVLRPGGRLVAQCGGAGNIADLERILRELAADGGETFTFATPEATRTRLEVAGFTQVETWLTDEPVRLDPGGPLQTYLETVCLRAHLARLPEPERRPFVEAVASRMSEPVLDYVRLNISAIRGGSRRHRAPSGH
jgi:trans-aconitate 2-methyltransferase